MGSVQQPAWMLRGASWGKCGWPSRHKTETGRVLKASKPLGPGGFDKQLGYSHHLLASCTPFVKVWALQKIALWESFIPPSIDLRSTVEPNHMRTWYLRKNGKGCSHEELGMSPSPSRKREGTSLHLFFFFFFFFL